MTEKLQNQLNFIGISDGLKSVYRQTMLQDDSRFESSAEHSWHFALMALTLLEYSAIETVDINRVIKMAIIHDLIEVYAGDTPAHDIEASIGKEEREREAADKLFALLPEDTECDFRSLWEEFEAVQTPDALYANAVDRFQSFYLIDRKGDGKTWTKFSATASRVRTRMLPVKTALPALWSFIEEKIAENVKKGFLVDA